ncbi:ELMO/CED-12 family-domain-containing protein [Phakopsora pachyrhizi]|uniref:ELMO/CED-12 family-domain-containing protein n=1 Tax=Phakopsora pachyrhizi TaxID=170000 RepID=A0AAV0ANB2_PHAPC|nr:ELMO/CED-12 family-domain-containing protein [Phakopsora pachyrhizi]
MKTSTSSPTGFIPPISTITNNSISSSSSASSSSPNCYAHQPQPQSLQNRLTYQSQPSPLSPNSPHQTPTQNAQCLNDSTHPIGITPQLTQMAADAITLPTILITYQNLVTHHVKSVKARVDRNVPLEEVIRQLCNSAQLAIQDPFENFALRDASNNELVTQDNIFRKVETGNLAFKLVRSPKLEAKDLVERLATVDLVRDQKKLKLSLFSLKDYLREPDFISEFQTRGGERELVRLCQSASGNTLAYALSALQVLIEQSTFKQVNQDLDSAFIDRLSSLLASSASINVLRPTSAIIRKLISQDLQPRAQMALTSVLRVIDSSEEGEDLVCLLARRIGLGPTSDFSLAQVSLSLVNTLTRVIACEDGQEDRLVWYLYRFERAEMRKAVLKLNEGRAERALDDVEADILNFQKNVELINSRLLNIAVTAEDPDHVEQLMEMADRARDLDQRANSMKEDLEEKVSDEELEARKWKTLGFDSENLLDDFERVGLLGLRLMYWFTTSNLNKFDKFIAEQLLKPDNRRCPFAKASNKCTEILADIFEWNISSAQSEQQMTVHRPFELKYPELHELSLDFFRLMWNESGATTNDFERVGILVRSQMRNTIKNVESFTLPFKTSWNNLVKEFQNVEYVKVRDRQMKELAMEDSLWAKQPVRNLRSKLYQEAFEFVKIQRINTLLRGSWFPHHKEHSNPNQHNQQALGSRLGLNIASLKSHQSLTTAPRNEGDMIRWRYYRLSPNKKYLHYLESSHPVQVKNGVEEMPDRIDLSLITEIVGGGGTHRNSNGAISDSATPDQINDQAMSRRISTLSSTSTSDSLVAVGNPVHKKNSTNSSGANISLMNGDHLVARLHPSNAHIHSEWLDGLNMVKVGSEAGAMTTKESAEIVYDLTQIGTMIQLLDLSGERVEIPSYMNVPPVPLSSDFFYSEGSNDAIVQ